VAARSACDREGAALIFDEVQTGMGRTGTLWAYEQTAVVPDALTSAKALGGGLPIGALVTGEKLADTLQPGDHASTFAGGPVACAAALVALEICSDRQLLEHVAEAGERFMGALAELPDVVSVQGRGLLVGAELAPGVSAIEIARRALLEERLVINAIGPSRLRLEPPLIGTDAQLDDALARLKRLLA
jgi:acetylornithine/N-succinyldiaminopimelate aminotransferase